MQSGNIRVKDKIFKPYISQERIAKRVEELGAQISRDYKNQSPFFLGILNGAFIFAADLMKAITIDCEISFVKLASYSGTSSTGNLIELIGLEQDLRNKQVIIIEDIVDSGNTLTRFLPVLQSHQPTDIKICSLLFKPQALKHPITIDYLGFEIPNDFIVGYGLDYDGFGRNLRDIYQIVE